MVSNILNVEWVFVDTVIIILLFLLLISVKIFKTTHRWRLSFSNEALEYHSFPKANENEKNQFINTKHCYLTKNNSIRKQNSNLPLILILRTNFKRKFIHILTEGLSSYGFNVINIKVKIKGNLNHNLLDKIIFEELSSLISKIVKYFQNKKLVTQSNYILLNYSKSSFSYRIFLTDSKNLGMILLNPKLNIFNIKNYQNIFDSSNHNNQLYTIFSRKSIFIFKNKNLKHFLKEFKKYKTDKIKIITLEKANRSFKYYETLLLGMIIGLIEDKLLNCKN